MAINVRIDLILLKKLIYFEEELKFIQIITKKFSRASMAWFYRKLLFSLVLNNKITELVSAAKKIEYQHTQKHIEDVFKTLSLY